MSGQTTQPFYLPYPTLESPEDAADITCIQTLAQRLQTVVGRDSGVLSLTVQSGMTGSVHYQKLGCVVNLNIAVTYKPTAALPLKNAKVWVCEVPSGYRPAFDSTGAGIAGTNVALRWYIQQSTGNVWFMNVNSTAAIFMCASISYLVSYS